MLAAAVAALLAQSTALDHLPVYQALECMHRARRDPYKQRVPLPERTEFMLDEGLRALAS